MTVKELIKEKGFSIKNVTLYGVDADGNHNDFERDYIDCDDIYDEFEVHDYIVNDENIIIFIKTDNIYAVACITGNLDYKKVTRDNFFEQFSQQDRGHIYLYDRCDTLEEVENKFENCQSHAEKISGTLTLEYTLYALAKWDAEDDLWEEIRYAGWDEATKFRWDEEDIMNRYFVTTYEKFRSMANDDAYAWSLNNYTPDELTNDDIINEYGDDFISQLMTEEDAYKELNLHDDTYGVFSLDDLCEKTRDCLQDIC